MLRDLDAPRAPSEACCPAPLATLTSDWQTLAAFAQQRQKICLWPTSGWCFGKVLDPLFPRAEDTFGEPSCTSPKSTQVWRAGARVGLPFQEGKMLSHTPLARYPEQGTARGGIGLCGCVFTGTGGVSEEAANPGPRLATHSSL